MKRTWIGIVLLASILAVGLWLSDYMEKIHLPGAEDLQQASRLALEDDWEKAEALVTRARKNWQEKRPVTASFANHEPMEDIEGMFAKLEVYGKTKDTASFCGTCLFLSEQLEALARSHSLSLPHFL